LDLKTQAEIAQIVDVRPQAVSAAVRARRLHADPAGFIDLDAEETQYYVKRASSQRAEGKRKRGRNTYRTVIRKKQAERAVEQAEDEDEEDLYGRATVEEALREMLGRCLDDVRRAFVPVACSQLAEAVRKASSEKKGAALIRKEIDSLISDLEEESEIEFSVRYIFDGADAAYAWYDANYDEDGNRLGTVGRESATVIPKSKSKPRVRQKE